MPKKHALLAGINDYRRSPLAYCIDDSQLLAKSLRAYGYRDLKLIRNPTSNEIQARLGDCAALEPGDSLLFFFAGHGVTDGNRSYLIGSGTDDRLSLLEVASLMDASPAHQKILICDCCRSNADWAHDTDSSMSRQMFDELSQIADTRQLRPASDLNEPSWKRAGEQWAMLLSCSTGERSWESQRLGHGVFSHYLAQALDQFSGRRVERVSTGELATSVMEYLTQWNRDNPDRAMRPFPAGLADLVPMGAIGRSRPAQTGNVWMTIPASGAIDEFQITGGPVSVETYSSIATLPAHSPDNNPNWTFRERAMTCVSWDRAMDWCRRMGGSLPTEAQWNYVQRLALPQVAYSVREWCRDDVGRNGRKLIRKDHRRDTAPPGHVADDLGFRLVR